MDTSRLGHCYPLSGRYVMGHFNEPVTLVHGTIRSLGNPRIGHAWVQLPDGIWEPASNVVWDTADFTTRFNPCIQAEFTPTQVSITMLRTGHWGPWASPITS